MRAGGRPKVSWWQVLRVVLVLGWLAWAGLAWWAAPRESSAEQARADLAAGRLTYYEWGDGWRNDGGLISPYPVGLESTAAPGQMLLWHTTDGRQHYTTVDLPTLFDEAGLGPQADALDKELQAYEARRPADPPIDSVRTALFVAGCVLFLWALVSAADPVTGTRWFWFWLVTLTPGGLGLLWWLARERPWSPRAPGRQKRLKWWAGIGVAFLGGLAVSLALWGLHGVLGGNVVPLNR